MKKDYNIKTKLYGSLAHITDNYLKTTDRLYEFYINFRD